MDPTQSRADIYIRIPGRTSSHVPGSERQRRGSVPIWERRELNHIICIIIQEKRVIIARRYGHKHAAAVSRDHPISIRVLTHNGNRFHCRAVHVTDSGFGYQIGNRGCRYTVLKHSRAVGRRSIQDRRVVDRNHVHSDCQCCAGHAGVPQIVRRQDEIRHAVEIQGRSEYHAVQSRVDVRDISAN